MKTGILFAGQGQQFLNMGHDLAEEYPRAREIYTKANEILGYDVLNLSSENLNKTQYTQPAIYTLNYVLSEVLNIKADAVCGLSLGEYSALVYSGVISFEDGLKIIKQRALIMENAFKPNETAMMALLKTDIESVKKAIEGLDLAICNYNTPSQIVVGGTMEAVKLAKPILKKRGIALSIILKVSSVSHMYLMEDAAKLLKDVLSQYKFLTPKINFINNLEAKIQNNDFVDSLSRQICEMTRMYESILLMSDMGISNFIEIGPKGSLSKFVKEICPKASTINIYDVEGIKLWKNK